MLEEEELWEVIKRLKRASRWSPKGTRHKFAISLGEETVKVVMIVSSGTILN